MSPQRVLPDRRIGLCANRPVPSSTNRRRVHMRPAATARRRPTRTGSPLTTGPPRTHSSSCGTPRHAQHQQTAPCHRPATAARRIGTAGFVGDVGQVRCHGHVEVTDDHRAPAEVVAAPVVAEFFAVASPEGWSRWHQRSSRTWRVSQRTSETRCSSFVRRCRSTAPGVAEVIRQGVPPSAFRLPPADGTARLHHATALLDRQIPSALGDEGAGHSKRRNAVSSVWFATQSETVTTVARRSQTFRGASMI